MITLFLLSGPYILARVIPPRSTAVVERDGVVERYALWQDGRLVSTGAVGLPPNDPSAPKCDVELDNLYVMRGQEIRMRGRATIV